MKLSYGLLLSVFCSPFIITSASAECKTGKPSKDPSEHRCIVKENVEPICPEKSFYSRKTKDCSVCEEGYKWSRFKKICEKSKATSENPETK